MVQAMAQGVNNRNIESCPPDIVARLLQGGVYIWIYLDYDGEGKHRIYIGEGDCLLHRIGGEHRLLKMEVIDNEFWLGTDFLYRKRGGVPLTLPLKTGEEYSVKKAEFLNAEAKEARVRVEANLIRHINEINRLREESRLRGENEVIPYNFEQFGCDNPPFPLTDSVILLNKQINTPNWRGSQTVANRRLYNMSREEFCPGYNFNHWDMRRIAGSDLSSFQLTELTEPRPGEILVGGFPSDNTPLNIEGQVNEPEQPNKFTRVRNFLAGGLGSLGAVLTWFSSRTQRRF